jgi:hypothetical protein
VVLDYYGTRGAVKCKLFALTLKGTAVAGFLRHTPLQTVRKPLITGLVTPREGISILSAYSIL